MIKKYKSVFITLGIIVLFGGLIALSILFSDKENTKRNDLNINETLTQINIGQSLNNEVGKTILDTQDIETVKKIINRAERTVCLNRCPDGQRCTSHCQIEHTDDPDYLLKLFNGKGETVKTLDLWLYDYTWGYIAYNQPDSSVINYIFTPEDTITLRELVINAPFLTTTTQ